MQVQLLHQTLVLLVHGQAKLRHVRAHCIISRAVQKNELHVIHVLAYVLVFVFFQLRLDCPEVHRPLDDLWVIRDL